MVTNVCAIFIRQHNPRDPFTDHVHNPTHVGESKRYGRQGPERH